MMSYREKAEQETRNRVEGGRAKMYAQIQSLKTYYESHATVNAPQSSRTIS